MLSVPPEVTLPQEVSADGFGVHPALLDAALHAVAVDAPAGVELPFGFETFDFLAEASGVSSSEAGVANIVILPTFTLHL